MSNLLLPHTFTFPFLYLILSHTFIRKKKKYLSYGCSSTLPLHLPLSPSHFLNSLTSSSPQLITSPFHLSLSPFQLLNSLNSSSPQLIAPPISYLNPVLGFFLIFLWSLCFFLLFEFQRCVLFPLVSLSIFCCCIHLGALSCMSLWIKLYKAIVMFVVQSENITCYWEFSAHCAGLRLVHVYKCGQSNPLVNYRLPSTVIVKYMERKYTNTGL